MKVDSDAAVDFLKALRPGGPWSLSAIVPDGPSFGATFTELEQARAWIVEHGLRCNLHFCPNPTPEPTGAAGRWKKADVPFVDTVHADVDDDEQGPIDGDSERKAAAVQRLCDCEVPPTFVIDSGGGVQGLWRLDKPVDVETGEAINLALIEQLGGDRATWNADRPLRLPGTINHPNAKKRSRGRKPQPTALLDSTGQVHDASTFPRSDRPAPVQEVAVEFDAPEPVEDLEALGLPDWLVELVRTGESSRTYDSRSEALLAAVTGLLRHQVKPEQVLGIILDPDYAISESVLGNTGRTPQDYAARQVRRGLAFIDDTSGLEEPVDLEGSKDLSVAGLSYVMADQVQEKPLNPLWPGRIFIGKLTTGAGIPDQGKSVVTCDITARVTRGLEWPDGRGRAPQGTVIILSAEDDPEDTIKPRLLAAGADTSKVIIVNSLVKQGKGKRMLSISEDLPKLAALARQHPETRLLIIDPINAYIGTSKEHDSFRDSDVRAVLGPVKEWAEQHQIAVLIITHFKKGGSGRAIDQVMGSLAFTALSRSAWAFIEERDKDGQPTGRKLMAKIKQNITAPVDSLAYRLVGVMVGDGIEAPRVEWGEEVKGTADDLMAGTKERASPKLIQAQLFLMDLLAEGPVLASEVSKRARELGIAEKTLARAKEELEVESTQHCEGFEGRWVWRSKADADDDL